MIKRLFTCTIFGVLGLTMVVPIFGQQAELRVENDGNPRLATPRAAVENFLKWQNPPLNDIAIAAEALSSDSNLSQREREKLARQLKRVLDGRGLLVKLENLPDSANHVDPATNQPEFVLFPNKLPEVYLTKTGDNWTFSQTTIAAIPQLYSETYSKTAEWIVDKLPGFFHTAFLGVALWQYAGLFILLLLGGLLRKVIEYVLENYLLRLTAKTSWQWDDVLLHNILKPFSFLAMVIFFSLFYSDLQFPIEVNVVIRIALELLAAFSLLWLVFRLVDVFADYLAKITKATESKFDDQLVPLLRKTLKFFAFTLGIITIIQNYGYSVSSLLAGLGIGGLAVALAARDTLANFFGSIMIFADKPFQVGDWIISNGVEGTVEEVGFRSSRIRTFYNSVVSVPNSKLADAAIDNMGLRQYRRLKTTIGLTYSTTAEQMHAFVEGIRAAIKANDKIRQDFYEIHFNEFGDFSLNVLVYCFFDVGSWSEELRERHNFLLEVLRLAEKLGVEFAFPTQTVHIDSFYKDEPREVGKRLSDAEMAGVITGFGPNGKFSRPHGPVFTHNGKPINYSPATQQARGEGE